MCTRLNYNCATSCNCKFCTYFCKYVCLNCENCTFAKCVVCCYEVVFFGNCCICKDCYLVIWLKSLQSCFSFRFGKAFAIDATSTNKTATCVTIFVEFVIELVDVCPTISLLCPNLAIKNKFSTVCATLEHFFHGWSKVNVFPKSCCEGWHCYFCTICNFKTCRCACCKFVLCQSGQIDVSTACNFDCAIFANCECGVCWSSYICLNTECCTMTKYVVCNNRLVLIGDYCICEKSYFVARLDVLQSFLSFALSQVFAIDCDFKYQSATIVAVLVVVAIKLVICCRNFCLSYDNYSTNGAVRTLCSTRSETCWGFCWVDNFGMRKHVDCLAALCFLTNITCVDCFVTVSRACRFYLFGCKCPVAIDVDVSPTRCCLCPGLCSKNKCCTCLAFGHHGFHDWSQVCIAPKLSGKRWHCYLCVCCNFEMSLFACVEIGLCEVGQIDVSTVCYFDCSTFANYKLCSNWSNDISGNCKCCIWSKCVVCRNKCVNAVDCCICKDNYCIVWFEVE